MSIFRCRDPAPGAPLPLLLSREASNECLCNNYDIDFDYVVVVVVEDDVNDGDSIYFYMHFSASLLHILC